MLKADFFSLPANEILSNTNSTQENTLNKGSSNFSRTGNTFPEPELIKRQGLCPEMEHHNR